MTDEILGRVSGVELEQKSSLLEGFCIDNPTTGEIISSYQTAIRGWVLGQRSRVRNLQLIDPSLSRVFRETPLNETRPDVANHYPHAEAAENSGFQIPFSLLNLQPKSVVQVAVVLEDSSWVQLAAVFFSRRKLIVDYRPKIQPLMVSCLGRSGSTWLMEVLKQHPEVVVHGTTPYESRLCKYYVHNMLKSLSEPSSAINVTFPDETYAANAHWLSAELPHDPIQFQRFRREHIERLAVFCQQEIDEVYDLVAKQQNKDSRPRFFAEKHGAGHTPRLLWELYPHAKEIILIRDFRDMFCSALAFNKQRMVRDFGMQIARNDLDFLAITGERVKGLMNSVNSRDRDVFVMKYEDLVKKPAKTIIEALEYVGIAHDPGIVEQILQRSLEYNRPDHRTSSSANNSIGRWKKDLPRSLHKSCEEAFGEALEKFGYA